MYKSSWICCVTHNERGVKSWQECRRLSLRKCSIGALGLRRPVVGVNEVISRDGVGCHTSGSGLRIQSSSRVSIKGPPRQLTNRSDTVYDESGSQCMTVGLWLTHTHTGVCQGLTTDRWWRWRANTLSYLCDTSGDPQINDSPTMSRRTLHHNVSVFYNGLYLFRWIWCMSGHVIRCVCSVRNSLPFRVSWAKRLHWHPTLITISQVQQFKNSDVIFKATPRQRTFTV